MLSSITAIRYGKFAALRMSMSSSLVKVASNSFLSLAFT